jgi:folate-dependent phosphoribosylglycinamide formyltransferase PurN
MYRIGWFSTGRDKAARDLLKTVQHNISCGEINAEIAFVFSNREPGEDKESDLFLKLAESYSLPKVCLSSQRFKVQGGKALQDWHLEYDTEIMKRLGRLKPDLCVLAGYMLIVGEEMCQQYTMINLHPAAPSGPSGTWQEVIWKLIEGKASESGVMMHLVTPQLDQGPPVTYCTFSIRGEPFDKYWKEIENYPLDGLKRAQGEDNPLFKLIRQHELVREFPLLLATLKAFAEGGVRIERGKIVDTQGKPAEGYNLTAEIDTRI